MHQRREYIFGYFERIYGAGQKTPVTLFNGDDVSMNFLFYNKKETIQTGDYYFNEVDRTDSTVAMRLSADSASYIDFTYAMHNDTYLIDFTIHAVNMEGKLAATNNYVDIEWAQRAHQIEKVILTKPFVRTDV